MSISTASFDIDARTDRGRQRSNNQDSIGRADRWNDKDGRPIDRSLRERYGRLYIVADGVGGNADGADASRLVVDEVMRLFYYDTHLPDDAEERLRIAIERATGVVHAEAKRRRNNMASTIVAALICESTLIIANVGDSPAFLFRAGQAPKLLTKAHVRREADGGTSLAQAMGDQQVYPAIFSTPFQTGDAVVLCSDGLTDLVQPAEIADIVATRSAGDATRALIEMANRRGGHDNISAIVVRNGPSPAPSKGFVLPKWGVPAAMFVSAGMLVAVLVIAMLWSRPPSSGQPTLPQPNKPQSIATGSNHTTTPDIVPTSTLGAAPTATDTPTPAPTRRPPTPRPTMLAQSNATSAPPITTTVESNSEPRMPNLIGKHRDDAIREL
ncbi:MAG: PP2C family protein-serine/threonine phosphatase, partial [Roseiflexus sp.]